MEEARKGGKEERRECGRVKGRKEKERSVKSRSRIKRVICYSLSKKICVESIRNFTSTDRYFFPSFIEKEHFKSRHMFDWIRKSK